MLLSMTGSSAVRYTGSQPKGPSLLICGNKGFWLKQIA